MKAWRLTDDTLKAWVRRMLEAGLEVAAPVDRGTLRTFRLVAADTPMALRGAPARWSPKEFLFPRTERVFTYTAHGDDVTLAPAPEPAARQVLLGVRACDAAGFCRLDSVLSGDHADTLFAARRRNTTIVSLACTAAEPGCFCSAVGGHPAGEEGVDAQLLPDGDGWLVRPLTEKGEALTALLDGAPAADDDAWRAARAPSERLAAEIAGTPYAQDWAAALEKSFDQPLWDALGMRCLGCSICNYLCPSCSCFDVQDSGSVVCGERCRSWDSCTFALFTRHGSGHNPRTTQAARYRQRVLHKFAYFPLAHDGLPMCTGCGRCARHCPVGLGIRDAVERGVAAVEAT